MFKKRAAVFYRSIKTPGVAEHASCFYSDKTRAVSFFERLQNNIPQKTCLLGAQTKVQMVRRNINILSSVRA